MHVMVSDVPLLLKRMEKQGQQKKTYITPVVWPILTHSNANVWSLRAVKGVVTKVSCLPQSDS